MRDPARRDATLSALWVASHHRELDHNIVDRVDTHVRQHSCSRPLAASTIADSTSHHSLLCMLSTIRSNGLSEGVMTIYPGSAPKM